MLIFPLDRFPLDRRRRRSKLLYSVHPYSALTSCARAEARATDPLPLPDPGCRRRIRAAAVGRSVARIAPRRIPCFSSVSRHHTLSPLRHASPPPDAPPRTPPGAFVRVAERTASHAAARSSRRRRRQPAALQLRPSRHSGHPDLDPLQPPLRIAPLLRMATAGGSFAIPRSSAASRRPGHPDLDLPQPRLSQRSSRSRRVRGARTPKCPPWRELDGES